MRIKETYFTHRIRIRKPSNPKRVNTKTPQTNLSPEMRKNGKYLCPLGQEKILFTGSCIAEWLYAPLRQRKKTKAAENMATDTSGDCRSRNRREKQFEQQAAACCSLFL